MNKILFHYQQIDPTTWVYLSSLLIVGLFFKFGRFWSVRNLDLVLVILLAPGLLLVSNGRETQRDAVAAIAMDRQRAALEAAEASAAEILAPPTDDESSDDEATKSDDEIADAADDEAERQEAVVPLTPAQEELREGRKVERIGFIWLLGASALLLVRLLIDSTMVRRPLLEPNLTTGGLTFSCVSLFAFLMANVIVSRPTADDLRGPTSAERLISRQINEDLDRHGPGYALIFALPSLPTVKSSNHLPNQRVDDPDLKHRLWNYHTEDGQPRIDVRAEYLQITPENEVQLREIDGTVLTIPLANLADRDFAFVQKIKAYTAVAKLVAFLSQLAIVVGVIAIGYWHFNNVKMGVGAATLYLMLPYTSQMTGRVDHVLPAALLVWAILFYRRPLTSGIFVGMAIGVVYYPLFLLPLWFSFYWERGLMRFTTGVVAVLALMVLLLAFVSPDAATFWQGVREMFGLRTPRMVGLSGIWGLGWDPVYRYPVLSCLHCSQRLAGDLAGSEEPGHLAQLFRGHHGCHAILARPRRGSVYGLVLTAAAPDGFPTQSGRSRRIERLGRRVVASPSAAPRQPG